MATQLDVDEILEEKSALLTDTAKQALISQLLEADLKVKDPRVTEPPYHKLVERAKQVGSKDEAVAFLANNPISRCFNGATNIILGAAKKDYFAWLQYTQLSLDELRHNEASPNLSLIRALQLISSADNISELYAQFAQDFKPCLDYLSSEQQQEFFTKFLGAVSMHFRQIALENAEQLGQSEFIAESAGDNSKNENMLRFIAVLLGFKPNKIEAEFFRFLKENSDIKDFSPDNISDLLKILDSKLTQTAILLPLLAKAEELWIDMPFPGIDGWNNQAASQREILRKLNEAKVLQDNSEASFEFFDEEVFQHYLNWVKQGIQNNTIDEGDTFARLSSDKIKFLCVDNFYLKIMTEGVTDVYGLAEVYMATTLEEKLKAALPVFKNLNALQDITLRQEAYASLSNNILSVASQKDKDYLFGLTEVLTTTSLEEKLKAALPVFQKLNTLQDVALRQEVYASLSESILSAASQQDQDYLEQAIKNIDSVIQHLPDGDEHAYELVFSALIRHVMASEHGKHNKNLQRQLGHLAGALRKSEFADAQNLQRDLGSFMKAQLDLKQTITEVGKILAEDRNRNPGNQAFLSSIDEFETQFSESLALICESQLLHTTEESFAESIAHSVEKLNENIEKLQHQLKEVDPQAKQQENELVQSDSSESVPNVKPQPAAHRDKRSRLDRFLEGLKEKLRSILSFSLFKKHRNHANDKASQSNVELVRTIHQKKIDEVPKFERYSDTAKFHPEMLPDYATEVQGVKKEEQQGADERPDAEPKVKPPKMNAR